MFVTARFNINKTLSEGAIEAGMARYLRAIKAMGGSCSLQFVVRLNSSSMTSLWLLDFPRVFFGPQNNALNSHLLSYFESEDRYATL